MISVRNISLVLLLLMVSSCEDNTNRFQGYVEGEYIYVASPIEGRLDKLLVSRGQMIEAGAPLFALEQENEAAAERQAREQLDAAQSQLEDIKKGKRPVELNVYRAQLQQAVTAEHLSATQLKRDEQQLKIGAISQAQLDSSRDTNHRDKEKIDELRNQLSSAELPSREKQIQAQESQVKAAQAVLEQAQWKLNQKSVKSTEACLVFDTLYVQGEWVAAGNPIVSLLPPGNIKVRFFVPETEVGKIKTGEAVMMHCDGCAQDVAATVTYISPQSEYTPPVIYSNTTRGKLVFMIEARPKPEDAPKLHPGQPVEVILNGKQ
jgi:HlyD family secretion protein